MLSTTLLEPTARVKDVERRRQSYLLAALMLVTVIALFFCVAVWVGVMHTPIGSNPEISIAVLAALGLIVCYSLARNGRYELGAGLAVVVTVCGLFAAAVPSPNVSDIHLLMWLLIPVLISSLFLKLRTTIGLVALLMLGMAIFTALVPGVSMTIIVPGPVAFVLFTSILVILFTQQRNALEADRRAILNEKDRLLTTLTEGMSDVLGQMDVNGIMRYVSPSVRKIAGCDPADLVGKPYSLEPIHPDDRAAVLASGEHAMDTTEPIRYEYRYRHADGHYVWLETIAQPIVKTGTSAHMVTVTRDISARKQAQGDLRRQNELLQAVLDRIPVMITIYDQDLHFKLFNREYTRLLGWTMDDARDPNLIERVLPDAEARARIVKLMRDPPPGWNDDQSISASGEYIATTWANVVLSDGTGVAIGQDIRDRKRAQAGLEQQVAARTAELSQINEQLHEEIRQREEAEQRQANEHALLRTLFDIVPDNVYVKDLEGRFLLANATLAKWVGVASGDALIGKHSQAFLSAEEADELTADDAVIYATGTALINKEESTIGADGMVSWFLNTKVPLRDSNGSIIGLVGVSRNITARRNAEGSLRKLNLELEQRVEQRTVELSGANSRLEAEINERMQAESTLQELANALEQQARTLDEVLSATPELFAMLDREGRYLYLNPAALSALGLIAEFAYHKSWRDLKLPDEFGAPLDARLARVFSTGKMDIADQRIVIKNEIRDFESILSPIHDLSGQVVAAVMTARDVTEHKRTESALRASEERYRIVSELISDYAYSYDVAPDGAISSDWTTESFTRVTGYPIAGDSISRGQYTLYHPDDKEQAALDVERVLQGEAVTSEYRIIRRDGVMRWLRIHRDPVWDAEHTRIVRYYGVAEDVTEEKLAEREKLALAIERERMSLMGRFVLAVSHDFRTSLANIETSRYLISRILDREGLIRVQPKLETIHECVDHLTTQLENFSTVSFLADPNLRACSVNMLVRELIDEHRPEANERGLTLTAELDFSIPPVMADEGELKRALRHMVANALNFTASGGTVTVKTYAMDRQIAVEVRDTGVGIQPDHLAHIFDLFYRADPARAIHSGGVGLGLSIVKMVAEAHSGRVIVESTVGQGSSFTLVLPAAESAEAV